MKIPSKEQIEKAALNFRDPNVSYGFEEGATWMEEQLDPLINEWVDVSRDDVDRESYPNDFDPVLCLTEDGTYLVLQLLHYTSSILDSEWETIGLKKNQSHPIGFVKKYQYIFEPEK